MTNAATGLAVRESTAGRLSISGRSQMGRLPGFRIAATGSYVPSTVVTNGDLSALGCDSDWIVQRTGILERRKAGPSQATSDLAYEAAQRCLTNASVRPTDIDLVIVATMTPDHWTPSTACLLQHRLGCIAPAMDLNAACSGFMYGLVTAGQFVRSGAARRALVVGSEVMTQTVDPTDVKTYPLFGDGAGAALLVPAGDTDKFGLDSYTLGAEGIGGPQLCIPAGGSRQPLTETGLRDHQQYLKMEGRAVFKWAVRVVSESVRDVAAHAERSLAAIDSFILHQANVRIIDAAVTDLNIDRDKVFVNLDRYGNTSAASIPLALDEAVSAGKIKTGSQVLLCGFGAGLTWGTALMTW